VSDLAQDGCSVPKAQALSENAVGSAIGWDSHGIELALDGSSESWKTVKSARAGWIESTDVGPIRLKVLLQYSFKFAFSFSMASSSHVKPSEGDSDCV
jgi:hypothetical protein